MFQFRSIVASCCFLFAATSFLCSYVVAAETIESPADDQEHSFEGTLRVLSYNIHHAEGVDGKLDLVRIANLIKSVRADIVLLQEVDQEVARSESVDQPTQFGALTKMEFAFGKNIPLQGGGYGNAILSRWPIRDIQNHLLPNLENGEQRGVLSGVIEIGSAELPAIRVLATHFDHRRKDEERFQSAAKVTEMIIGTTEMPVLFGGDLNDDAESRTVKRLSENLVFTNQKPLPTIPVTKPTRQIDFIAYYPATAWKVLETTVLDEAIASDHRAILSVLEFQPNAK
ncbi:Endonuclease/Exonuclease/phosphatase family protein [Roseimaritima multifibrata]|uniref:Endonuclease/Exonuclease/phosphatase family protein n=1 Tax=Roseimaritima multifibrata TaxID=1930274 RepID=A0A517MEP1_9BACT|nr:endonuclease/exonuclease/phosphatase family protein [Roseimaritima multifibrata]QDS93348.1 Endonuclease/Exonuclease/phosphatase family protein [Roseimaritima multifibrata]